MDGYAKNKFDEMVLAMLYLNMTEEFGATRAWKSFAWEALDRLHEKGFIGDPKSKAKSVVMTEEGLALAEALFVKHFGAE